MSANYDEKEGYKMPKFKEKNTIEKVFNDGRDMIPFVTAEGHVIRRQRSIARSIPL